MARQQSRPMSPLSEYGLWSASVTLLPRLVLAIVLAAGSAASQQSNIRFEKLSVEQGLSQSIVNVIHKDRKGFMWFGTQSGLNRYDGSRFQVYMHDPFDPTSLGENNVQTIAEDQSGALWIGTNNGGLNRFSWETGAFTRFQSVEGDSETIGNNNVAFVYVDRNDVVWVFGAAGGVDRFDRRKETFVRIRHDPGDTLSLSDDRVISVGEDLAGNLWIGTVRGLNRLVERTGELPESKRYGFEKYFLGAETPSTPSALAILSIFESPSAPGVLWLGAGPSDAPNAGAGLIRFDFEGGSFEQFRHDTKNPRSLSSDRVFGVSEDSRGNLLIGTAYGVNRFDQRARTFQTFLPDPGNADLAANFIRNGVEDIHGDFWVSTAAANGVYQFSREQMSFIHHRNIPGDPWSLSNDNVSVMYADSTGVLWIGTNTGGLSKVDLYGKKFETYRSDPESPNSLSGPVARAFAEGPDGSLYVGVAGGGVNRYDKTRTRVRHYRASASEGGGLSNDNVWSLLMDRDGTLWVGTLGGGLNRLDPSTGLIRWYQNRPGDPRSLSSIGVRAIYQDTKGRLWIGTEGGGLDRFDKASGSFQHYQNDPADPASLSNNIVRAIAEDSEGNLWIGTFYGGLNKFSPSTGTFQRFLHDPDDPESLPSNLIQSLAMADDRTLWIGTFGGGLCRMDLQTERFKSYTQQNSELPNNVIYGVLEDRKGRIWASSNMGLTRFDPHSGEFLTYDVDDGLQSREFNGQACFRSATGELFFGGIEGFNAFDPDRIVDNPYVPQIAITGFHLFNKTVPIGGDSPLRKHITETYEITLKHWQNYITFDFVALQFNRPEKNRYRYMLVNYDPTWQSANDRLSATYTGLEPGEYFFRVRGSNSDGVWNEAGAAIRIVITPPWWRTIQAFVSYAVALVLLGAGGYRMERQRLIRREREKALMREAELRAQTAEAQARAVEAENLRKTQELEQARRLQLSMLPRQLPVLPNLEIAVHMQTATEVGGDYYDFAVDDDGGLTVVVGDATGHGLSAGTMVSVVKSLFIANPPREDFQTFFKNCTRTIRRLHLGNLYMGLSLVRIKERGLVLSAAGMPPAYLFRQATGEVEELVVKGMPLGAVDQFAYEDRRADLQVGDSLLLLSDGLPELFNEARESFDYARVRSAFRQVGGESSEAIVEHLIYEGEQWRNGRAPNDDVTFVVIKVKDGSGRART